MTAADLVQLLDLHADAVGAMAGWIARRFAVEAADVAQDLALILLRDWPRYDPARCPVRLWLWRRWAAEHARTARRLPVLAPTADADPLDLVEGREPDPAAAAERKELLAAVGAAVGRLGERERRVLRERYAGGRRQAEVGRSFGVSRAMASLIERRAVAKLRAAVSG
jgi:RNA polymerase sigma factor (sigma-70 family)